MKHIKKFNEDLNTTNFKDLDSWSVTKANAPKKSGTKTLDRDLGQKVLDLFEKYELVIDFNNTSGRQPSLPGEDNFVEWRCSLLEKKSFTDWLEYEYNETEKELDKKTLKERQKIYNDYDGDELFNCNFSVFLPNGVKDIQSGLADASTYLSQLNNSAISVLQADVDEHYSMVAHEVEEMKKFIKLRQIIINNDNLEILPDISYRLYHDCKFVRHFYEEFGEDEGKEFFKEWLQILGEKSNF